MRLSTQTLTLLKNYALINAGIWINKGSKLETISQTKNMLAKAIITDSFPMDFGVYDLNELLAVITFHKDADLEFDEHHIIIKGMSGRSNLKYRTSHKSVITTVPEKEIKFPEAEIKFLLEESDYAWITNTTKLLKSTHIAVKGDGKTAYLTTFNLGNDSSHVETLELGPSNVDKKYTMIFEAGDWDKILPGSYDVEVSSKKIAHFKSKLQPLEYYIGLVKEESVYDE